MAIDWDKTGALVGAITGIAGMVTGFGGLWLGLANRRHARDQTSTRLRIEPGYESDGSPSKRVFFVRIVNDSAFAVRIDQVGLALDDEGNPETIPVFELVGGAPRLVNPRHSRSLDEPYSDLPVEIPARSSVTFRLSLREIIALGVMRFDHAFAVTATGERFESTRKGPLAGKTLVEMRAAYDAANA